MTANTQAMCASFKSDILANFHNFSSSNVAKTASTADTFYGALFYTNNGMGVGTTVYSSTGEVSGTGYTAGGKSVGAWNAPANNGTSAYTTPTTNLQWTGLTISTAFDTLLIYNQSQSPGTHAVATYNFGSQTITAGTLTLTMPSNAVGTALIQIT